MRLGTLLLPFLIGYGGTDADLTSTPAVAASPKAEVQETPTPPPTTVEPSASPDPMVPSIAEFIMRTSPWPTGSRPHDVAPALEGGACYTAQGSGELG